MAKEQVSALVKASSPRFQSIYSQVGNVVRTVFPDAEEGIQYKMPGWTVPLPKHLVPAKVGTMDPTRMYVLLGEGRSGITVHAWNPLDYHQLEAHRSHLEKSGFDVMVGCLRWTRKSEFPIKEVEKVVRGMKARLNPRRS